MSISSGLILGFEVLIQVKAGELRFILFCSRAGPGLVGIFGGKLETEIELGEKNSLALSALSHTSFVRNSVPLVFFFFFFRLFSLC